MPYKVQLVKKLQPIDNPIRFCFAKWTCYRLTEDADFGKKKNIFSDEAHFELGGYVNKQNCRIVGTENPYAYIEKPRYTSQSLFGADFGSRDIIRPFFFENEQVKAVTVNGDRYRAMLNEFLLTKIEEENIGNIWLYFNMMALPATQLKLHSMFCAMILKIALSAAEQMSFGHPRAAIRHRWTIIFGMPLKISDTPISQRQLTL